MFTFKRIKKMITKKQAQDNGFKTIESDKKIAEQKDEKLAALKKLIPNLVNSDGQVDKQALDDFINIANTTSNNKGYELTFAGKGLARVKADSETTKELQTQKKQSKDFENTENVVIRGDNLEVLKVLQQNYFGKIKMIYIDPPYNTKSENFIYNDNFKQNEQDLLKTYGLDEEEDKETLNFLHNVYGTRSHSGWLSFMYPRLKLARDLLKEDGVIFISIDDNEQANLKILCDEIFGEENFICNLIVKDNAKRQKRDKITIQTEHQCCLVYSKNLNYQLNYYVSSHRKFFIENFSTYKSLINKESITQKEFRILLKFNNIFLKDKGLKEYKYQDNKGIFREDNINMKLGKGFDFEIINPVNNLFLKKPKHKWCSKEKFLETNMFIENIDGYLEFLHKEEIVEITQGKYHYANIIFGENQITYAKTYLDVNVVQNTLITNYQGSDENYLEKLLDKSCFSFPKITGFIVDLLKISTNPNDLILDFFAGSGTTGDAVMQLNAEDGGNRKFILVQLDEVIDKKKNQEAYNFCIENKFKPVISSITLERLNRAGEKIKKENEGKLDFDKQKLDIGYKVFSLTEKPKIAEQPDDNQQAIFKLNNKRTETINTLYNMLCATCKPLHTKIIEIIKDKLYQADTEIYLLAEVTQEDLEPHKELKINIDGWSDISLENWLNLDVGNKENITVVY